MAAVILPMSAAHLVSVCTDDRDVLDLNAVLIIAARRDNPGPHDRRWQRHVTSSLGDAGRALRADRRGVAGQTHIWPIAELTCDHRWSRELDARARHPRARRPCGGAPALAAAPSRMRRFASIRGRARTASRRHVAPLATATVDRRRRLARAAHARSRAGPPAFWHEAAGRSSPAISSSQAAASMIHWSRGGDLRQYLASLERVLALEPARLLPAHGPAIDDPDAAADAHIEHRLGASGRCSPRWPTAATPCRRSPNPSIMDSPRR